MRVRICIADDSLCDPIVVPPHIDILPIVHFEAAVAPPFFGFPCSYVCVLPAGSRHRGTFTGNVVLSVALPELRCLVLEHAALNG